MAFQTMSGIPKVTSTANFYSNTNPLLQSRGIGGFAEPSALFGAGEQGAWWDFSDSSVTCSDTAGTPAALESTVAMVLDKRLQLAGTGADFWNSNINSAAGSNATIVKRPDNSFDITVTTASFPGVSVTTGGFTAGDFWKLDFSWSGNDEGRNICSNIGGANRIYGNAVSGSTVAYMQVTGSAACTLFTNNGQVGDTFNIKVNSLQKLPGNHLIQATAGARPTLSRRYNSLPNTRNLGAWGGTGATASGTIVGSVIEDAGVGTVHRSFLSASPFSVNTAYTLSADIYPSGRTWAYFGFTDGVSEKAAYINLTDGSLGAVINGATVNFVRPIGNGGFRVSINGTVSGGAAFLNMLIAGATGNNGTIYNGTLGNVALQWSRPDVRLVADAALVIPEYQYADSTTVYDTLGFPAYLLFDGAKSLVPTAIPLGTQLNSTVIAAVQPTAILANDQGVYAERDNTAAGNINGQLDYTAAGNVRYAVRGSTGLASAVGSAIAITTTNVLSGTYDGNNIRIRYNGVDSAGGVAVSGAIAVSAPSVGREDTIAGGANFFVGRMYGIIVRGAITNDNDLQMCEKWMGSKCGKFF